MALRSQTVKSSLLQIARSWPADKLRPTLQFGGAIQAATARIFDLPPLPATAEKAQNATAPIDEAHKAGKELIGNNLENAEKSLAALSRILNSSARKAVSLRSSCLGDSSIGVRFADEHLHSFFR